MNEVKWFKEMLLKNYQSVVEGDITYEGVELGKDEVDLSFLPQEVIDSMPEYLLFDTLFWSDHDSQTEWLAFIVIHPVANTEWIKVIKRDDEVVYLEIETEEGKGV